MPFIKSWLVDLFHFHKWKVISTGILVGEYGSHIGKWYNLQCVHCGKLKVRSLIT